jgi:DNA-binding transcriptional regulator YhcF (GntR family)
MEILVNLDDPRPMFAQLVDQIKKAIAAQAITAGDPLPSIRQLANDLELNSKTVAKAYRLLERDSVIQAKGYRGTFVHPDALKNIETNLNDHIETALNEVVLKLRELGATDSEIRITFTNAMNVPYIKGEK